MCCSLASSIRGVPDSGQHTGGKGNHRGCCRLRRLQVQQVLNFTIIIGIMFSMITTLL